jgi:hypothetical protein
LHLSLPKDVMVVEPGQNRNGDNDTGPLHRLTQGRVLAQRQVRANLIVIAKIQCQNTPQMPFAEDQDMIQALAQKRSDQAFSVWILPRRSRSRIPIARSRRVKACPYAPSLSRTK